ncbi:MAG: 23S rRNA (adenine(2503)-C2)-methyltransferase [Phycisphaerae bacterium]|nr:23S rRNA (adenine(2503)-C2)-methyltransferase [Phycisphaerae bacterium]
MPPPSGQIDAALASTRADFRLRARSAGESADQADAHWIDVHRHGRKRSERDINQRTNENGTIKFTLGLGDGHESESVILPMTGRTGRERLTLCLSSQVGCALGCGFCETAAMGFIRNLTVAEIIDQWHVARFRLDAAISNIVFMGMGEPMENLDAVLEAIRILTDRSGPGIAPSRIAVSTVGRIAGIRKYTDFMTHPDFRRVRLAVSINAPNPDIRRELMPVTKADPMPDLHAAMSDWIKAGGKPILVEYVLIPGVNDDEDHPRQLAQWLDKLDCRVNVIPYNPRRNSPWPAPDECTVTSFVDSLRDRGCRVHRRKTLGRNVMAACGQLGNQHIRRKTPLRVPGD